MIICDVLHDLGPLVQFKKRENTHGGVFLLTRLQALVWNFTKSIIFSWVFFKFLKLYKWYQIMQNFTYLICCNSHKDKQFKKYTELQKMYFKWTFLRYILYEIANFWSLNGS